ncbi:hypothetical protein QMY03_08970 [Arthrobacter sp. KFRI-F3372]|uniref:hypothetical protein n=1 Tax=Micrococcaceae TaxID=1268 RepID=UPI00278547AC|nr:MULTISPECIES: hypothetical protein [Micrococcaceae]MDP9988349.1 hypothetical protein [Arthrobacter oryzae]MEE2523847.1 hypothetical protein [Pseudarthrobacter sp. J47]MEE2530277.1 hypothetical protein [Pseudarthrobacter sp. J75]WHP61017.1 hypothetical protein QMY03_08970 [Arthrobacter sp. KFRI-F3372]
MSATRTRTAVLFSTLAGIALVAGTAVAGSGPATAAPAPAPVSSTVSAPAPVGADSPQRDAGETSGD